MCRSESVNGRNQAKYTHAHRNNIYTRLVAAVTASANPLAGHVQKAYCAGFEPSAL